MNLQEQKERILSGKMYNDQTEELVNARKETVFLTNQYNQSYGEAPEVREAILKKLLGSMGKNHLGDNFYANFDCVMLDGGGIYIGDDVLFGPRVGIYTCRHAYWHEERAKGACFGKPVKIGNKVWIGAGVHIDQGVTIGDNTIIGAGSVITRDVPANVVAAGVPCKVIRTITEAEKTDYMQILETEY